MPLGPFDTPLTPQEEILFKSWKAKFAPRDSGADYDLRGAFKAGVRPDPETNHWPDTFKKPNHPTFSVESQYARFAPEKAGQWVEGAYVPADLPYEPYIPPELSGAQADLFSKLKRLKR